MPVAAGHADDMPVRRPAIAVKKRQVCRADERRDPIE